MGEAKKAALRFDFGHSLKLELHVSKVTSDAGLLAYRELDDPLGLTAMAADLFDDWRTGQAIPQRLFKTIRRRISRLRPLAPVPT